MFVIVSNTFFVCVKILIHLLSTYRQVDLSAKQLIVDVTVEFDWNSNSWECKLPFQSILYFNRPRFLLIEKMPINFFNWSKFLSSDEFARIHSNLNFSNFTFFWSNLIKFDHFRAIFGQIPTVFTVDSHVFKPKIALFVEQWWFL